MLRSFWHRLFAAAPRRRMSQTRLVPDVDRLEPRILLTVSAEAGGPYSVMFGMPLSLYGTAMSDETGPINAFWDIDNDKKGDLYGESLTISWSDLVEDYGFAMGQQRTVVFVASFNGVTVFDTAQVDVAANQAPQAIPGGPYTLFAGDDLTLDGWSSWDFEFGSGPGLTHEWDLDNDGLADYSGEGPLIPWTTLSSTYGWAAGNSYQVTLKVSDGELTGTGTAQVQVEDSPTLPGGEGGSMPPVPPWGFGPPIARAIVPSSMETGETLVLDGSTSSDPDNDPLTYEWDLNDDGTWDIQGVSPSVSWATLKASYGYMKGAMKTVRLQVTDDDGFTSQDSASVMVNMPVVSITGPGQSLKESATGNGGGSFTVSRTGATDEPLTVALLTGGTATPGIDHTAIPGTVTIPLGQSSATITVNVSNDNEVENDEELAIVINNTADYIVGTEASAQVTLLSNDRWEWQQYTGDGVNTSDLSRIPELNPFGVPDDQGSYIAAAYNVTATNNSISVSMESRFEDVNAFGSVVHEAQDAATMNFAFDPISGTIYQNGDGGVGPIITRNGDLEAKASINGTINNNGTSQHSVTLQWQIAAVAAQSNSTSDGIKVQSPSLIGATPLPVFGIEITQSTSSYVGGRIADGGTITLVLQVVEIML